MSTSSFADLQLAGAKCLFVASNGGHLAEIQRIIDIIGPDPQSMLVTFETPQSQDLNLDYRIEFIPYVKPRDVRGVVRAGIAIELLLRRESWDAAISTGAAVALSALPMAAARNQRSIFVESYSRFDGPSLSGKLLARLPRIETFTQHEDWSSENWPYCGTVFDALSVPAARIQRTGAPRAFVTVGTIDPFRFDALVERVIETIPDDFDLAWQLGSSYRDNLPGTTFQFLSETEFDEQLKLATVVVCHAGVGTVMQAIEHGHKPIVIPRRASRGEHIDDHQGQLANDLARRKLAVVREVEQLSASDFVSFT